MNMHGKAVLSFRMFRPFSQAPSVHLSCLLFTFLTFLTAPAESALITFEYDPAGNMVSEQGKYYEYNDANQLVRVRKDSPTGEIIAEYVYDYQGQRVKKTENGVTTYYIGKHYEERKGDTVDEKTSYFFANSQRIAKSSQKNKAPPQVSYYLNNHLGSADVIIDEQGTQTDRLRYLPFGGYRTFPQGRHTFTGKERDEVTDNYYFEARYYNSNIRRFTQADTIVPDLYDPQSLNRYAYVTNNPLKYTDPTGHWRSGAWLGWDRWKKTSVHFRRTLGWAGESGFSMSDAELIAEGNWEVDNESEYKEDAPGRHKVVDNIDKREEYIKTELTESLDYKNKYNNTKNIALKNWYKYKSLKALGRALHSVQDKAYRMYNEDRKGSEYTYNEDNDLKPSTEEYYTRWQTLNILNQYKNANSINDIDLSVLTQCIDYNSAN